MKKVLIAFFITTIAVLVQLVPVVTLASDPPRGLVPECQSYTFAQGVTIQACNFCDFVQLFNNIIRFIIEISILLFVVVGVIIGFQLVTSAGNPSAMSAAKGKLVNLVIGFIIILSGWLIVDTLMKALVNSERLGRPWQEIECGTVNLPERTGAVDIGEDNFQPFDFPEVVDDAQNARIAQAIASGNVVEANGVAQVTFENEDGQQVQAQLRARTTIFHPYPSPDGGMDVAGFPSYAVADLPNSAAYTVPGGRGPQFVFGTTGNLNQQLSPNFRLGELVVTNSAERLINEKVIDANNFNLGVPKFVFIDPAAVLSLERVRSCIGAPIEINSGYRPPFYNVAIGGASDSRHMYGDAFDIRITASAARCEIQRCCIQEGAGFVKSDYESWVHCDWGPKRGGVDHYHESCR